MSTAFVTTAYGGPEHQQLIEREAPAPRAGEIAIAVRAAGVNPADIKRRQGAFGTSGSLPQAMGLEAAGTVTALGEGVEDVALGDEVLGSPARGQGAFAQSTVLKAAEAAHRPEALSPVDAATLPVAGATAYDLSHQVDLSRGDTVLVLGAGGGVGRMVLQILAARGIRALGVGSERSREGIEEAGAVLVPSGEGAVDAVRALAPEGAHLLIDLVGGEPLRALAPLVQDPSRVVSAADEETATELGGVGRARSTEALERIVDLVAAGTVDPQVRASVPLDRAAEAVAEVEAGRPGGKIVIVP